MCNRCSELEREIEELRKRIKNEYNTFWFEVPKTTLSTNIYRFTI